MSSYVMTYIAGRISQMNGEQNTKMDAAPAFQKNRAARLFARASS